MSSAGAQLTEGPVGRHLLRMTLPMVGGIFSMIAGNLVDTWFVARLGTDALAAISFTFPVVFTLSSVAIGLGAGSSSVLARALGRDDPEGVRRLTTDALILSVGITAALAVVGVLTIAPLFAALGAPAEMIPHIARYMQIWYLGIVFVVVPMVGMSAIRATGDARLPALLMISAAALNAALDPLFIFGLGPIPGLGLQGAAVAAVISRATSLLGALYILHARMGLISTARPPLRALRRSFAQILHVGLPAAGTNAIIPLSTGVITAMLAGFGPEVVAGFGLCSRVEAVALVIFYAMSSIIGPVVGQNLAAGQVGRVQRALGLSARFCLAYGLLLALALALLGQPIALRFDAHPGVVAVAARYFLIVPISYGAAGMVMINNAAFNGMGRPLPAVLVSLTRMVGIYVPLAYAGSRLWGASGLFAAYALANGVCGVGAYLWACRVSRRAA